MDLDDVYVQIGEFGLQQKLYFLSLCLFNLYAPFNLIQPVFTGRSPKFQCVFQNVTLNGTCPGGRVSECESLVYEAYPDSFAKSWSLVCDEAYKSKFVQSAFMAGVGVGAVTLGTVADTFGRRPTLGITLFLMVAFGILSSFAHSFYLYLFLRFLTGVSASGNILSAFVLSSELVGPNKRGLCGNIFQIFFAFGIVLYSLLAYYVKDWRALSVLASSVGIPYAFLFILLPESPRWLVTHGRSRDARKVLRLMANRNGMIFPSDLEILVPGPNANGGGTLIDLFKWRKTAFTTLIQMFSWFSNSAVYYGLTLASDSLGKNIFVSTMLSGFVETPSYIVTAILIDTIGRRVPLCMFMVVGGMSCGLIQIFHNPTVTVPLALIGKLSIAASFAIIYIHSTELFPTTHRSSGLGLCSLFARFGGIIAPFVSLLDQFEPLIQFTVFGLLSFSSGVLNLLLGETLNRTLPETLDDLLGNAGSENLRNERGRYARLENSDEVEESEEENDNGRRVKV